MSALECDAASFVHFLKLTMPRPPSCIQCLRTGRISQRTPQRIPHLRRRITITAPGGTQEDTSSQGFIGLPPPHSPSSSLFSEHRKADGDPDKPGHAPASEDAPPSDAHDGLFGTAFETQPEHGQETTAVARVPLPSPWIVPVRRSRQPFDTHAFVSRLETATLSPEISKALMETVRGLVMQRTDRSMANTLSKEELDNEAYLFKAALSKLRTEHSIRNRNTGIAARSAVSAIRRELDSVEVKMAEDVQVLKHDIELDVNNRKTDTRSDMKWADIQIEEINNRATISIGDLKTEIESAKWEATRRAIAIIVVLVVSGVAISTFAIPDSTPPIPPTPSPFVPDAAPPPPKMRDVGVGTEEDHFDYEARIDKLLSEVEKAERKERPRRPSKPDPFTGRI